MVFCFRNLKSGKITVDEGPTDCTPDLTCPGITTRLTVALGTGVILILKYEKRLVWLGEILYTKCNLRYINLVAVLDLKRNTVSQLISNSKTLQIGNKSSLNGIRDP